MCPVQTVTHVSGRSLASINYRARIEHSAFDRMLVHAKWNRRYASGWTKSSS